MCPDTVSFVRFRAASNDKVNYQSPREISHLLQWCTYLKLLKLPNVDKLTEVFGGLFQKIEESAGEIHSMKAKYHQSLAERQRLEQEVADLQKQRDEDRHDMDDLRQQQRQVISESGSSEVLNQVYTSAVDKYESIKQEYDQLRKQFADLQAVHTTCSSQLDLLREENSRLHKHTDEKVQECNAALKERKALQQQCTSAIMKWDSAIQEKGYLEKELQEMKKDRDNFTKKLSHAMAEKIKASKEVGRLRIERDAMVHEYSLIMSERDTVHKEIEQLQDKLSEANLKNKALEDGKKKMLNEVESLRREVTSTLHERDHAMKQVHELKKRQNDLVDKRSVSKDSDTMLGTDRDVSHLDHNGYKHSDRCLHGQYKASIEALDTKDMATKEADALKREVDKVQSELTGKAK